MVVAGWDGRVKKAMVALGVVMWLVLAIYYSGSSVVIAIGSIEVEGRWW